MGLILKQTYVWAPTDHELSNGTPLAMIGGLHLEEPGFESGTMEVRKWFMGSVLYKQVEGMRTRDTRRSQPHY